MNDNHPANPVRVGPGPGFRPVRIIGTVADDRVTITDPATWAKIRARPVRPGLRLVKAP